MSTEKRHPKVDALREAMAREDDLYETARPGAALSAHLETQAAVDAIEELLFDYEDLTSEDSNA